MKKTAFLIILFVFTAAALFAQTLPRFAVAEFITNNESEWLKEVSTAVREMVVSHMSGMRQYIIVSQNEIDSLLKNQQIEISSISGDENIEKLKKAKINYIVTGSINEGAGDYSIIVRLLDVFNAEFTYSERVSATGASREFANGVYDMMNKFISGIVNVGDRPVQSGMLTIDPVFTGGISFQTYRPIRSYWVSIAPDSTEFSIEVTTKGRGILYFQNQKATILWDNDTFTIPVERPGRYTLKMVFGNGDESTQVVTIESRGVTKVDFTYYVGGSGPAGGIVFYDKGYYSYGWRYLETAPANTEFTAQWGAFNRFISGTVVGGVQGTLGKRNTELIVNFLRTTNETGRAAQLCAQLNINGFADWYLPSKDELYLMFMNLANKGLGGFGISWYWSSSHYSNDLAWGQDFILGYQRNYYKNRTGSVRAVRAF